MPPLRLPAITQQQSTLTDQRKDYEASDSGARSGLVRSALMRQGYFVRDQLLPADVFEKLNRAVAASWNDGDHWQTLARLSLKTQTMSRQNQDAVHKIKALLQQKTPSSHFRYLYHALHQDRDHAGLISDIRGAVTSAWRHEIAAVTGKVTHFDFSLTAFTPGCFLDRHTDFRHRSKADSSDHQQQGEQQENDNYQLTLLLYFEAPCQGHLSGQDDPPEKNAYGNDLCFEYFGEQHVIAAKPNRSVLFVPSPETHHWVPEIATADAPASHVRLAFSGWLI